MSTLLALATVQAWFVAALVASRGERRLAERVLVVWLALLGFHTGSSWLFARLGWSPPLVMTLSSSFPFLQGPFLFVYVDALVSGRRRLPLWHAAHLLPAAAFVAYQWWGPLAGPAVTESAEGVRTLHIFAIPAPFNVLLLVSVPAYTAATLVSIRRYRRRLAHEVSTVEGVDLRWLRALVLGLGGVWLASVAAYLARSTAAGASRPPTHLVFVALAVFVYALGFLAAQRGVAARPPVTPAAAEAGTGSEKYRKSGLAENAAAALRRRLLEHMASARPHLDEGLDLAGLAAALGESPNRLSQVINEREGCSFYDFVNAHRVAEVERALKDPGQSERSLLDLALASGFRSKSTFNRIFKQRTGTTPSRYREGLTGPPSG